MPHEVTICPWSGELPSNVMNSWRASLRASNNLRAFHQTPEWVDLRFRSIKRSPISLAILGGSNREPIAVTPLARHKYVLRRTRLGNISVDGCLIVGSSPSFPDRPKDYEALLQAIFASLSSELVYVPGISFNDPFARFLMREAESNKRCWFVFYPEKPKDYYWIEMPGSFEEYSKKFRRKQSHNLRRELNRLRDFAKGSLKLMRVTDPDQVAMFVEGALSVARRSWQQQFLNHEIDEFSQQQGRRALKAFANQGILRSYMLTVDQLVCAFLVGFQMNDVFYFLETAYNPELARHSPGKCLFQLIIRDLFIWNKPRVAYFGHGGDYQYKEWFSTHSALETDVLILRNTAANRAKVAGYRLFQKAVSAIKAMGHKQVGSSLA